MLTYGTGTTSRQFLRCFSQTSCSGGLSAKGRRGIPSFLFTSILSIRPVVDINATFLIWLQRAISVLPECAFQEPHRGDFFGFKPTGKQVEWAGAALFTLRDGLVADLWVLGDLHGLSQLLEDNNE